MIVLRMNDTKTAGTVPKPFGNSNLDGHGSSVVGQTICTDGGKFSLSLLG